MGSSIGSLPHADQKAACEACADEIISRIPALADARGLPTGQLAMTVWLTLFRDLIGDGSDGPSVAELLALARMSACRMFDSTHST